MSRGARNTLAIAVTVALAGIASLGASSAAAGTNCPYISASALAKAVGQKHGDAYLHEGPTNPPGTAYQFSLCRAFAWSGKIPANEAEAQAKIKAGTVASVTIKTGEEAAGSPEAVTTWHTEFDDQVAAYHAGALATVGALHGAVIFPPALGAPAIFGFDVTKGGNNEASAIWYSDSQYDYIEITVVEAKKDHARKALEKIAATAVPAFGA